MCQRALQRGMAATHVGEIHREFVDGHAAASLEHVDTDDVAHHRADARRDEAERASGPRDVELPLALSASAVLARIEAQTGLQVHAFPKEREFFVELRLPMQLGDDSGRRWP